MTQEEKNSLLVDLCARLPYGVKVQCITKSAKIVNATPLTETLNTVLYRYVEEDNIELKPYLRPMSSMTINEKREYATFICSDSMTVGDMAGLIDWLNAHHFDYRGLIEKELALEAPESMYDLNK